MWRLNKRDAVGLDPNTGTDVERRGGLLSHVLDCVSKVLSTLSSFSLFRVLVFSCLGLPNKVLILH